MRVGDLARIGHCGVTRLSVNPSPHYAKPVFFIGNTRANPQVTMHMHREGGVFLAGTIPITLSCQ